MPAGKLDSACTDGGERAESLRESRNIRHFLAALAGRQICASASQNHISVAFVTRWYSRGAVKSRPRFIIAVESWE
jgi:hypothetical protein